MVNITERFMAVNFGYQGIKRKINLTHRDTLVLSTTYRIYPHCPLSCVSQLPSSPTHNCYPLNLSLCLCEAKIMNRNGKIWHDTFQC